MASLLQINREAVRSQPIYALLDPEDQAVVKGLANRLTKLGLRFERRLVGVNPGGLKGLVPTRARVPFADHPFVIKRGNEIVAGVIQPYLEGIGPEEAEALNEFCARYGLTWRVDLSACSHRCHVTSIVLWKAGEDYPLC